MKGETKLIPEVPYRKGTIFGDFGIGEGYVDNFLEVRVRITTKFYIHIKGNQVQFNTGENWPATSPKKIRYFKLITEEI